MTKQFQGRSVRGSGEVLFQKPNEIKGFLRFLRRAEKPKSFMQEFDQWTDATVVKPLVQAVMDDLKSNDPRFWEEVVEGVKKFGAFYALSHKRRHLVRRAWLGLVPSAVPNQGWAD
jgi:hypothetical protein